LERILVYKFLEGEDMVTDYADLYERKFFIICFVGRFMDYEKLMIRSYEFWDLKLHHEQALLGRHLFWYKGEESDFFDIPGEAREELTRISKLTKGIVNEIFSPDKWNYVCAGNRTTHLHWHNIPRYNEPREFCGYTFHDVAPHTLILPNQKVDDELVLKVRDDIKKRL